MVKETMVGRAAIIELPPMTGSELGIFDTAELMLKGGYPILYINGETPATFFPKYIRAYLEREVRDIHNILDLIEFKNFMFFCANRVGSILNYESMANSLDVSVGKIKDWLSILEAGYIIFRSPPYYNNFEKRLTKRPKLYFYDTGLAAYLLDIDSQEGLIRSDSKGKLFENLVVSEIKKKLLNQGFIYKPTYFWNIEKGEEEPYEIDLILKKNDVLKTVEIKASDKLQSNWFHGGARLGELTKVQKYVIYNGPTTITSDGTALNFKDLEKVFEDEWPS
jgi:predicted AAA+ superfamily ATPase